MENMPFSIRYWLPSGQCLLRNISIEFRRRSWPKINRNTKVFHTNGNMPQPWPHPMPISAEINIRNILGRTKFLAKHTACNPKCIYLIPTYFLHDSSIDWNCSQNIWWIFRLKIEIHSVTFCQRLFSHTRAWCIIGILLFHRQMVIRFRYLWMVDSLATRIRFGQNHQNE